MEKCKITVEIDCKIKENMDVVRARRRMSLTSLVTEYVKEGLKKDIKFLK